MEVNPACRITAYQDPVQHFVIDDFFPADIAHQLLEEFEDYDSERWFVYDSVLERKKAIREWGAFGATTYRTFQYLCSREFMSWLQNITGRPGLIPDPGLHGAGWHCHQAGDHLNLHLDYNLHPMLDLQRRYNLIIYLCPDWQETWHGALEFWDHDADSNQPARCRNAVFPAMNRAVLFDTSENCWHGFPQALACPSGVLRRSLAMYYLSEPEQPLAVRRRARYAARPDQRHDAEVLALIAKRSGQ